MAIDCFTHKLSSVAWNSITYASVVSATIQESVGWNESYAGGRTVACRALDTVSGTASVTLQKLVSPSAHGTTISDFVCTLADNVGTAITVTAADMRRNDVGIQMGNSPAEETLTFVYTPTSGTDVAWITVSG